MFIIKSLNFDNKKFIGIKINLFDPPFLLIIGEKGLLSCGYFNIETANKTKNVAVIVTGVSDFKDMLSAKITNLSEEAKKFGLKIGDFGEKSLKFI
jgi:uncharacterized protein YunC (DUF1805 family)